MQELQVTDLKAKLAAQDILLIDVREQDEWDAGHIATAIHNPMSAFDLSDIPADKEVWLICRSGNRSGRVGQFIEQNGLQAINVLGGMKAWELAGYEMDSESGIPTVI